MKPQLGSFLDSLTTLKDSFNIETFVDSLDTYVPSFSIIPTQDRDEAWTFLSQLNPEKRHLDQQFFTSLWKICEGKKIPLNTPIREIILISMLKHSGLYNEQQFSHFLGMLQKEFGYLPFELLIDFENEEDGIYPIESLMEWLKICLLGFGTSATINLLTTLCDKKPNDGYFDLETLWATSRLPTSTAKLSTKPMNHGHYKWAIILGEERVEILRRW